jgi:hypothetical protein
MGKLSKEFKALLANHQKGMKLVILWLRTYGANIDKYDRRNIIENTNIRIHMYHANDTIECGPCFKDEERKMFSIYSEQEISFKVPNTLIGSFLNAVHSHQPIGKYLIENNIVIDTDVSNSYTMNERISFSMFNNFAECEFRLRFKIYHLKEEA